MASAETRGEADARTGAAPGSVPDGPGGDAKITCNSVWKLFGPGADRFLASAGAAPSQADLAAAGLIGAVRDASLEIHEGEIFVIMGLSGSGKSTLVRCMSRLIEPTAGRILFEGQDLLAASEREMIEIRRHKMGMVFQHFALLPHLTVLGNVAFPLEIQGVSRAKRERRAREVIELVGLKGREDYYPRELSGGQQQRVGIARSLAVEPEIWLLDEPFSALDPLIRREMQDEFLRLQGLLHKTIVFITHDFEEAIRLADRIAIMNEGAIIQIGTPEDLVTRPAADYVAEFTRDIPRAKVLSARSVMSPEAIGSPGAAADGETAGAVMTAFDSGGAPTEGDFAGRVVAGDRIEVLAAEVMAAEKPFLVTDESGAGLGLLTREAVLQVLVGGGRGT